MDVEARVAIPLLEYAPITQNSLRTGVPNIRVGSDEGSRAYSFAIADDRDNLDTVIESAYRQIYFHAFKSDRDANLESQLKDGQITVRDFIRGLLLSDTFKRSFYGFNSNYKVVRHLTERILGRKVNGKGEELSWSIVIATKGLAGLVDVLLDSTEYLDAFGYDTVPFQRNRVLPGRALGDTPFNITSPRYDEYYRGILGFPQVVFMGGPGKALPARAKIKRGGSPSDYLDWLKDMPIPNTRGNVSNTEMDYMAKVPFRSIGR